MMDRCPPSHSPVRTALSGWTVIAVLAAAAIAGLLLSRARARGAPAGPTSAAMQLDVNRATAAELALLPGVGPYAAARVARERDRRGGLRSLAELDDPALLGPGASRRLRDFLRISADAPTQEERR